MKLEREYKLRLTVAHLKAAIKAHSNFGNISDYCPLSQAFNEVVPPRYKGKVCVGRQEAFLGEEGHKATPYFNIIPPLPVELYTTPGWEGVLKQLQKRTKRYTFRLKRETYNGTDGEDSFS